VPPRLVTIGIGLFFLVPGIAWFATRRWWDQSKKELAGEAGQVETQSEIGGTQA